MKKNITAVTVILTCLLWSCKKNIVTHVTGTINGTPAITLYGNSYLPTDYLFLSTDATKNLIAYNGVTYAYVHGTPATNIYLIYNGVTIAQCALTMAGSTTTITIDTCYNFNFGSKIYMTD